MKQQYYLPIGYEGKIDAEVFGMPRLPIFWKKSGVTLVYRDPAGNLTANKHNRYNIDFRGSLIIKEVESSDDGVYEMTVQFFASKDSKTTNVNVGCKFY